MNAEQAYKILENKTYKDITEKQNCLDIIKKNPQYAYRYGLNVIEGRFQEAEEYIKKDPDYAYLYSRDVIKGRWPEAEEYIKKDPYNAYSYARNVIEGRFLEAEEYIKKSPGNAYSYATDVIKGRFLEAEEYIKTDPDYAYLYSRGVIKGRFLEAEEFIKKNLDYAYRYARNVIKGRFLEAEESIKSSTALVKYCKYINQRVVEKEHLLKDKSKIDYYIYFNIPLPEEDYNKEIANGLIGKKSKYLEKIQKEKDLAIKHIKNLIDLGIISENDSIKNLINKQ